MKITRKNYEEYFIDYLEGNLDEKLVDEFIEFIQKNPDLKKELETFKSFFLEGEEIPFPGKHKLYKEIYDSEKEFDLASVAYLENDLSQDDKSGFGEYLKKNPEKEKEFLLFQKTKLQPDEKIRFRNRKKLYKTPASIRRIYAITRVAAVLLLFFSLAIILRQYSEINVPENQIVEATKDVDTKKEIKPQKTDIKKDPVKEQIKPTVKDTIKVENHKSIREKTRGRVEDGDFMAVVRDSVAPLPLAMLQAEIRYSFPAIALADIENPDQTEILLQTNGEEELLLGDKIKSKTGLDRLSLNDIAKAGLGLVSNISKNKFSFDTNEEGDITELNLDTRLLAFSIPTNKDEGE